MLNSLLYPKRKKSVSTIAFYNVENLFHPINDPNTRDDEFTPFGRRRWTLKRYETKIKKLSSVIAKLGMNRSKYPPAIVGLVEVESGEVVNDLAKSRYLRKHNYQYVHHNSPDERGIDVAMLYNKIAFELIESSTHPVFLENEHGERDYTRDILKVSGYLHGELTHILVNHWSSRRDGAEKTEHKRITAAKTVREIVAKIREKEMNPRIIIMGDFNDDPTSKSIQEYLVRDDFYNPMVSLFDNGKAGSLTYNGKWNLFDQIIFSKNFLEEEENPLSFYYAAVYNKKWMKIYKGKFKGNPFRTYVGPWYKGGFSDHFPVYAFLRK
ncbi:endonuclease [Polaribacter porphyrae]|uniref:Endonuclease n=1 Tax=Polaribacter porphyrae TaxID=1137780 RepID=A0A2S7WRK8_9FLAO|nr:endonuclease [Polaribacter porphyrae]PQJ80238.1 endonuclease [Polaribacter porphyrae]